PLKLDENKFEAQLARRILDRLVGYQLSPLLWKKVRRGLSAGRVQSVAVRLITEREREIRAFVKEEYWTITADLEGKLPPQFSAEGAVGLITYMRTDSTRLSNDALDAVRGYIAQRYGADYVPEKPNVYRSKKSAQDAHEAIRPTSIEYDPERVAPFLEKEELNLYTLIWNRFVACQMEAARLEQTSVDIKANDAIFRATGQVVKFDGF